MKVAVDITPLFNEHKYRGSGVYVKNLIASLGRLKSNLMYTFFVRGSKIPKDIDLIHYTYFDLFFLTLPLIKLHRTVVTVHDLIPIQFANHFPKGIRGEFKWQIQKQSLLGCKHIITDSNSSKSMIRACTGYLADNISVIYLAPGEFYTKNIQKVYSGTVKSGIKLPDRFILYVGDANWNKNVPGLLQAFQTIRKKFNFLYLVLVGKAFLNDNLMEAKSINKLIVELNLSNYVIKTGYITENLLSHIYKQAVGCIQPSFAEGFGLTVLEAMACGCPVVVSDKTSLSEIAGPAIRVNAASVQSIADGMEKLFKINRQIARSESLNWVKQFTWKRVAVETNNVYLKLLNN